ncbi:MAG: hypothetical protein Q8Q09_05635 [Deltaproteobacteria bacterium]|nr:hypothetical protein [Deltaproteobacteria bacterium]
MHLLLWTCALLDQALMPVPATAGLASTPVQTVQTAPPAGEPTIVDAPVISQPEPVPPLMAAPDEMPLRRVGVHLALNATLLVDFSFARIGYAGFATQLTGLGALVSPERNYTLSAQVLGGVALPLHTGQSLRLTADLTPALTYFHSAPVNMLSVGFLAGIRMVHRSGFTAALRLPLVGYAGAPDAQRGSLLYYYYGAIVTVPFLSFGYSF